MTALKMQKTNHIPYHTIRQRRPAGFFIKRLGEPTEDSSLTDRPHRDDYYMFVFVTRGQSKGIIDFEEIILGADEGVIVSPAQVHSPSKDSTDVAEGWLLALSAEHLSPDESEIIARYALKTEPVVFKDTRNSADLRLLYDMLLRHQSDTALAQSLASAIKNFFISNISLNPDGVSSRYTAITCRFKKLLDEKLSTLKSPSAYAAVLNISEVYLNEAVKAVTGLSVSAFIRRQAVQQARRMMTYTSLSGKEIACGLGYDDYAWFSKKFKQETGITPTQYRKNLK